jgi:hypothetical protein
MNKIFSFAFKKTNELLAIYSGDRKIATFSAKECPCEKAYLWAFGARERKNERWLGQKSGTEVPLRSLPNVKIPSF